MKKVTELGGFRIIQTSKQIRVETLMKGWAVEHQQGTKWFSSLDYHLKNDKENAKILLILAYSTNLMLSDFDFLKKYSDLVTESVSKVKQTNFDAEEEKIILSVEKLKSEGV